MVLSPVGQRVYYENVEGDVDWNIEPTHWDGRPPGLSAMVRVKDEAEWITYSLDSVVDWCDEVAIFLQGEQTDGTDKLVDEWAKKHPSKAAVYRYPFESVPNGPGHDQQTRGSLHERAYFYNWCHALTTYDHAMKWDGDMVAQDWLGPVVRREMDRHEVLRFCGAELIHGLRRLSSKPRTAREPRVWKVSEATWWFTGTHCEHFTRGHQDGHLIDDYGYVHLKWAKAIESARKDWTPNWREQEFWQRINDKQIAGKPYTGPWPACMMGLLRR